MFGVRKVEDFDRCHLIDHFGQPDPDDAVRSDPVLDRNQLAPARNRQTVDSSKPRIRWRSQDLDPTVRPHQAQPAAVIGNQGLPAIGKDHDPLWGEKRTWWDNRFEAVRTGCQSIDCPNRSITYQDCSVSFDKKIVELVLFAFGGGSDPHHELSAVEIERQQL